MGDWLDTLMEEQPDRVRAIPTTEWKKLTARYPGSCVLCSKEIAVGDFCLWIAEEGVVACFSCMNKTRYRQRDPAYAEREKREKERKQLIESKRHTRAQLAEWGVPWPPPKGWKSQLIRSGDGLPSDYQERTERAQRLIRGEPVEPELVEISRVLVIEGDQLCCSFCSSRAVTLRAVAGSPEIEPDQATLLVRCHDCGVTFAALFTESESGVEIAVEEVQ